MLDPIFRHFIDAERSHMNVETEPRTYSYGGGRGADKIFWRLVSGRVAKVFGGGMSKYFGGEVVKFWGGCQILLGVEWQFLWGRVAWQNILVRGSPKKIAVGYQILGGGVERQIYFSTSSKKFWPPHPQIFCHATSLNYFCHPTTKNFATHL